MIKNTNNFNIDKNNLVQFKINNGIGMLYI